MKPTIVLWMLLVPVFTWSQVVDTAGVVRQVDSLIQVSRALTGQGNFEKALAVNTAAENLVLEKLGKESAVYGSTCFNRGRVLYFNSDYVEAEKWYLTSKNIREKVLGKENLDYAASLNNLGTLYLDMAEYEKAEPFFIESKSIREKVLGKGHALYATSLNNLGNLYERIGDYKQAEPLFIESTLVKEKIFGKEHPEYAWSLYKLGNLYLEMGNYEKSEPLLLESLVIQEKAIDKEHSDYLMVLNKLTDLYCNIGNCAKSEPLLLEVLAIQEKVLGKGHPDYSITLIYLARLYRKIGNYKKAELLLLDVLTIKEKTLGKEHTDYIKTLGNLANLYVDMADYEKAEPLYLEAKAIWEKTVGKEHTDYAINIDNLANLYSDVGNYERAEVLYLEAKNIWEKTSGKNLDYARSLSHLAILYSYLDNYEKAEPLYLEAKVIREKLSGRENAEYASTLDNLAILYSHLGNYEKAEPLCLEAKTIRGKVFSKEHPKYAISLNNLAVLYRDMGNYEKAEPLYLEAKTIWAKSLGKIHPKYAGSINNLADLYYDMGNYEKAEPLYLEANTILEKALGKEHPDYILSLNNLANLYKGLKNYEKTEQMFDQIAYLDKRLIAKSLKYLSERELNIYLHKISSIQNQILSFEQTTSKSASHTPQVCYDNSLFYKGFLLNAANQVKHIALSDAATTEKFNLLKSYHRRLATEYAAPIIDRDSATVAELEEKANTLEKELTRTVAGFGEAIRQVNWPEVQANLKPAEAAIEFVHYRFSNPNPTDSIMYAALLLQPGDTAPQFIPLFEEKELTSLLRGAIGGNNFLKINALYSQKRLYELIWQPLESQLQNVKTIYCSPSGLLHRLNLAAIPTADGAAFGDQRQLVLLGSTRQLVVPNVEVNHTSNNAYLAGGIRYESDSIAIATANRSISGSRGLELPEGAPRFYADSSSIRGGVLDYLPATATEVQAIGRMLTTANISARIDTGFYATEEAFRHLGMDAPSPRIIHLATHGYFFPDPQDKRPKAAGTFGQESVFKMSEHPMIRSGLILAGAKRAWLTGKHPQNLEDGILTAYEISQMNLSNTELVVLSACETGLGDIAGNEGVFGLQRAFKIAGAKYLIMSLWKVDDRSTQDFMIAFYRHWLAEKRTIPQAFHLAQQEMRVRHPSAYDWAGFVLIE